MPIRPEMRSRYPKNWKSEIVPAIRARSGNRCECVGQCEQLHAGNRCAAPHGEIVRRHLVSPALWTRDLLTADHYGRAIQIVLTVAHIDHVPEHCDPANLLHLCQRCHLLLDRHEHARNAAATRRRLKAAGDLFPL